MSPEEIRSEATLYMLIGAIGAVVNFAAWVVVESEWSAAIHAISVVISLVLIFTGWLIRKLA